MATDNKDSHHRKHRRSSSDEEAEKSTKRHKHRHHHRHRHRSKKHEEESKAVDDTSSPRSPAPAPAPMPIAKRASQPDDDVEEGEILDDNSDGDNKAVEFRPILEDHRDSHPLEDAVVKSSEDNSMENQNDVSNGDGLVPDGDGSECGRDHKGASLPSKCRNRGTDLEVEDLEAYIKNPCDMRKLSSESSGESYRRSRHSTLDERYTDHSIDKLRHHDVVIESYSKGMGDEEVHRKRHHSECDRNQGRRHGSRVKDDERERSVSYSRYDGEGHYSNLDNRGRESREKDVYKDRRNKDREKSKDYEMERRRGEEASRRADKEADNGRRKDKERNRSRDRDVEKHQIKEHKVTKYEDVDNYRRSERARSRSRDREVDLDRRRGKERDKSRDRVGVSDHDRERRKDRDGYRERDRGDERQTGRSKDRSRYSEIDGDRDSYTRFKSLKEGGAESRPDRTKRSHTEYVEAGSKQRRDVGEDEDIEEGIALKPVEEEDEVNRIIEESRKRKQAILEKYKNHQMVQQNEVSSEVKKVVVPVESPGQAVAADLAPDCGAATDDLDTYVADPSLAVGKSLVGNGSIAPDTTPEAAGLGEGSPKSEKSGGMFCDDIFGETPTGVRKMGKGDAFPVIRSALNDNWDDAEGYYSYRFGELLDGRYEITAAHGKGVFSTVVRAKDLKAGNGDLDEVAIKIIRNNETMHKAGQLEVQILKKLAGADPENKRHCVRFLSSFKYRNHLCLVFESLHMNLREVLKKFGRNIGLSLTAVRAYAKQLFIALKHLKNCGVLHCDIKPDNMLVNEAKNVLKLCDFGNAMFAGKNEITPYLVSRFYRAPEIILGLTYDHPMDIWSVGCCLYELYTGKVLFPGPSNNDMLRLHMELKGPFPKKMLRKGVFADQHFDQDLNFYAIEEDLVTKKTLKRMILNIKQKDIGSIVKSSSSTVEEGKMLANFKDLLDKIFVLDPEKRITVAQALAHPFITGK